MIHARLMQLAREVPHLIGIATLAGLVLAAASVGQALLVTLALADLFHGDPHGAMTALVAALAVLVARGLLVHGRHLLEAHVSAAVRRRVRERLVRALMDAGADSAALARSGGAASTLTDGVDSLGAYYSVYLPQLVVTTIVPPVLTVVVALVYPPAAIPLGLCVLVVLVVPRIKDRRLVEVGRHRWGAHIDLAADYVESMNGVTTLRSLGAGSRRRDALEGRSERLYRATMAELKVSLMENGVTAFLSQAGPALAVVLTAVAATSQPAQVGAPAVVLVLLLARETFRPLEHLASAWHAGYLGVTAIDGIDALLGSEPAVSQERARPHQGVVAAPTVVLRGVAVTYPGSDRPALDDIDLTLAAGTVTALVGASGAGKTTLTSVLTRRRDPDAGAVELDGIDIREIPLPVLRASMAVVDQHPYLFSGTIAQTLRLGRPDATDEQLVAAAIDAAVHDDIMALPLGYDTMLTEGATNLSGGQRQRLAIARALVRDARLLVLDEVTSHLDETAGQVVHDSIRRAAAGRTCLVVAHRLTTVMDADHVVVLDHGRVVEQGRPVELLDIGGPFSHLVNAQEALV